MVFIDQEGKTGHRWWLWVFLGEDTVVFRLDPSRSHEVPEGHFPAGAHVVLMVDRYSAYKAMTQVKLGDVVLVFCWCMFGGISSLSVKAGQNTRNGAGLAAANSRSVSL